MIALNVQPRSSYDWKAFSRTFPGYSIALDGFVKAPSMRSFRGPYANFDHHADVDRLSCRSTCEQVYLEINMGLFKVFQKDGLPHAEIWVNDCDEDTCLSVWLLRNHEQVVGHANPAINRLVSCEDRLDSTGGGYQLGQISMARKMAWIFELYHQARYSGALKDMTAEVMKGLIEATCQRISAYVINGGQELPLEGNYERLGGGDSWVMVKEQGPFSRRAMFQDGIDAFVSLVGQKDGRYVYSVGRRSPWVKFDLKAIFYALNVKELEKNPKLVNDKWGPMEAHAMIGGSPRVHGSCLAPEEVEVVVSAVLRVEKFFPDRYRDPVKFSSTNNYGCGPKDEDDVYTVEEFKEQCASGGFADSDGFGHPVKNGKADPSCLIYPSAWDQIPKDATHIVWYNK